MNLKDIEALRSRDGDEPGPSSLDLDRLAAGGGDAGLRAEVEADPALRNELARRQQGLDGLPGVDAAALKARVLAAAAPPPARRWPAWLRAPWAWSAIAVGAAAAAAVVIAVRPPVSAPTVRAKGALKLMVFRQVGDDEAVEAISGDAFHAGDRLKFKVSLPEAGRVRVAGVDAEGTLYTAWPLPEHAGADEVLPAGDAVFLPGAVALDDAPGPEQLFLVHCPPDVEPACASAGPGAPPRCPAGCATTPFTLNKAP
ncbi:MAG: hypothetical protein H6706_14020 [Myxococcales bacterium]|nr:hypothetical protein [Myxococcales bacterium]